MKSDARKEAIRTALDKLTSNQLERILSADRMVCDGFAYESSTGRY